MNLSRRSFFSQIMAVVFALAFAKRFASRESDAKPPMLRHCLPKGMKKDPMGVLKRNRVYGMSVDFEAETIDEAIFKFGRDKLS